jgi:hypothetical protein
LIFFVFPKGLYDQMPALVVDRSYWDHWLVWEALSSGIPVLDATRVVVPVHQNHSYGYHPQGKQGTCDDALAKRNFDLSGNGKHLRSMLNSTHRFTLTGKIWCSRFRRQLANAPVLKLRQIFVEKSFGLRRRLGLRTQNLDKLLGRKTDWID